MGRSTVSPWTVKRGDGRLACRAQRERSTDGKLRTRQPRVTPVPRSTLLLFFLTCLLLTGCGKRGPELVSVYGQLLFNGKPPESVKAVGGTVIYTPLDIPDGLPNRPAVGNFDEDGHFEVSSYRQGDGIVPGTYGVRIQCWIKRPLGFTHPGTTAMPPGYSPPQLVVERDSDDVEVVYNVKTK